MTIYNYCPKCGKELGLNKFNIPTCDKCILSYYQNSKPTVGIIPVKNGKVLIARRGEEPHKGELDIIGGFLNDGEHPIDGARREALEETNLVIEPTEFFDITIDKYSIGNHYTLNIYYLGKVISGEMKVLDDVASLEWMNIEELPLTEGFPTTIGIFKKLKEWHKNNQAIS